MKTQVLDSWAVMEWIIGGPPGTTVALLLDEAASGRSRILMSAINVGEVFYFLNKTKNADLARRWREASNTLPITIEVPNGDDIWAAATLNGQFPISYADAFAAALAQKYNCPLVTGDPEFYSVPDLQLNWIGNPQP